ncbi:MAG: hypothetical protein R3B60_00285 [Candidatus Paceibacterota bacterium]
MKKFTKIAILFYFLTCSLLVVAEEVFEPKPAFTKMTPEAMKQFVNYADVPKVIQQYGLAFALGVAACETMGANAETRAFYAFDKLPERIRDNPLKCAEAWVKYNNLPAQLTVEEFFQIRDNRGLFHIAPGFFSQAGSNNEPVSVEKTETKIIKPSSKPEVDPAYLFAKQFQDNQERIKRQEAEIARLREQNSDNATKVQKINELEGELESLRSLMGKLEQAQRELALGHSTNVGVQEGHQKLLGEATRGLQRVEAELRKMQRYPIWGLVGFGTLSLIIIGILIALWRFNISTKRKFASVNGRFDDLEEQVDDLEELVDEEVVDLSGIVIHDKHLLSKENINSLSYDKDSDTNSVSVLVTKPFGSDTAEITVTVTRINKNQLKVNIPRNAGEKRERIVDINTRSLVKMIKKADKQDLLFPVRLKQVS